MVSKDFIQGLLKDIDTTLKDLKDKYSNYELMSGLATYVAMEAGHRFTTEEHLSEILQHNII